MVKREEMRLTDLQQRYIGFLDYRADPHNLTEIARYFGVPNTKEAYDALRKDLYDLRSKGVIKSRIGHHPEFVGKMELYTLTKKGSRLKKRLQEGKLEGKLVDMTPITRVAASIFMIIGIILMAAPDFLTGTGNAIASRTGPSSLNIVFFLALTLTILGEILFFRDLKK
jgi:hypothetical protein